MHSKWKWKSARSCIKSKRKLKREGWEEKSKESQTFYSLTAAQIDKHDRGQLCATSCYPSGNPLVPTHTHTFTEATGNMAPPNVLKTLQFCSVVKFNFLVEFMRKLQKSYSNCLASHQRYGQCKEGCGAIKWPGESVESAGCG